MSIYTDEELSERLEAASLRYISPDSKGFTRKKQGKGFVYLNTKGERITDPALLEWIKALVIPPAWKQVWISPKKNGHLLATGRDEKGRKQYIYHPNWSAIANEKKFESLIEFGDTLPELRRTVQQHLREPALSRQKVLALVVALLDQTLIRIGSEEYKRDNETYGLTTLQDDHAAVRGAEITFQFVGKSGKAHIITLKDKKLAKLVRKTQEIPGYTLFQYVDENGVPRAIDSSHVNTYLHEITGKPFTAKIFRTWGGSVNMVRELCMSGGSTVTAKKKCVREGVKVVANILGNTTSVSRAYYIHPGVIDAFMEDRLRPLYDEKLTEVKADDRGLKVEEQVLMALMLTAKEVVEAKTIG